MMILMGGLIYLPSCLWLVPILIAYIVHAVLWTDHIYYPPSNDYSWDLSGLNKFNIAFDESSFEVPASLLSGYTVLLKVRVSSHLGGKVFDPFIDIKNASGKRQQQYFERGCFGVRYVNLTPSVERLSSQNNKLALSGTYCSFDTRNAELITFKKPELNGKKVMVIAPHADDAEIAAFGLYRHTDSMVVTVTAGEAEPETFSQYCEDQREAALLKGRVRAWDSVSIPKWGGLKEGRAINLGYFCKRLQAMYENPDQTVGSEHADIVDARIFREFNSVKLRSDEHGGSSWRQLVDDLSELLESFQPDFIVTPHLTVDPHSDHHYSTLAIQEALAETRQTQVQMLFYANHLKGTDMYPFGPAGTLCSLPPIIGQSTKLSGVFSLTLNEQDLIDKILALEMNHDLRRPVRAKKWIRKRLQKKLIGRYQPDYGEDEFLRKAVRINEMFFY